MPVGTGRERCASRELCGRRAVFFPQPRTHSAGPLPAQGDNKVHGSLSKTIRGVAGNPLSARLLRGPGVEPLTRNEAW
ncbi:hypothetical protein NDU88_004675 [Pleurodeles waltl]|uniref:Uncharacterized protein n=1 Tax=Pleurodeles waltl TaxID=8319 RepID=A0AAV7W9L5_PLEWA|nr:hypothetical protein NDU88_004675 [Pleurodeles waltl]